MIRYSLVLLACSLGMACTSNRSDNLPFEIQTIRVDFADMDISIPATYKLISTDQLIDIWKGSDIPKGIVDKVVGLMEASKSFPTKTVIYSDTARVENNIWFQQADHFQLTEAIADQYVVNLEQRFQNEWIEEGIKYDRIDKAFFRRDGVHALKLKYLMRVAGHSRFTTQYLISTNKYTFGIIVNNSTMEDFEDLVRQLTIE